MVLPGPVMVMDTDSSSDAFDSSSELFNEMLADFGLSGGSDISDESGSSLPFDTSGDSTFPDDTSSSTRTTRHKMTWMSQMTDLPGWPGQAKESPVFGAGADPTTTALPSNTRAPGVRQSASSSTVISSPTAYPVAANNVAQGSHTSSSHSSGMSAGEIAAAVVVPVVVVTAAVALLIFFLIRRSRRRRLQNSAYEEPRSPMQTRQMGMPPQLPPLTIPTKAIPTGSQFGTGRNTSQPSPTFEHMPPLPEKHEVNVTSMNASSSAFHSQASSIHRDPFATPTGSEGRGHGYLGAEISPVNEAEHRVSTINEVTTQREIDEISAVSDLSYQEEEIAEVNVAQRASVVHMSSGHTPRGSTSRHPSQ